MFREFVLESATDAFIYHNSDAYNEKQGLYTQPYSHIQRLKLNMPKD